MRIGPIERAGFDEGVGFDPSFWFYHAIGSGVFVRTALFHRLQVCFSHRVSMPRVACGVCRLQVRAPVVC